MHKKNPHIETLRGIAIFLVVAGHVIGSTPIGGMKIDFPSIWRFLYLWIDYLQMPLFTIIAGWVYALRPVERSFRNTFITKKIFRLLIPMATVGTIYFFIQYLIPGTNNKSNLLESWRIYLFPYTIYWYLPSLFIMFLLIMFIDIKKWANQFSGWIYITIGAYLFMLIQQNIIPESLPNIFSYKGAVLLFPYFILGVGIQRFSPKLFSYKKKYIYLLFTFIGIIFCGLKWFYPLQNSALYENLKPLGIMSLLILLLHQNHTSHFWVWIGKYTYSIYLFHGFGTSGGRIILSYLGVQNQLIVFTISTSIALLGPILIDTILSQWNILKITLLGKTDKHL